MRKFFLDLYQIRPSQLYLDRLKIDRLKEGFDPVNIRNNAPLPVRKIGGEVCLTDGHARAFLYDRSGISLIPVYWDEEDSNDGLYVSRLQWCRKEKVVFIGDLTERILPHDQYVRRWIRRCEAESARLKNEE